MKKLNRFIVKMFDAEIKRFETYIKVLDKANVYGTFTGPFDKSVNAHKKKIEEIKNLRKQFCENNNIPLTP